VPWQAGELPGEECINSPASQDDVGKADVKVMMWQGQDLESVVKIVAIGVRDSIVKMLR